jgi:hypothetical protein
MHKRPKIDTSDESGQEAMCVTSHFIEQCWGYAKWLYLMKPESSKEDQLKINALECLDAIPIELMRRYVPEI